MSVIIQNVMDQNKNYKLSICLATAGVAGILLGRGCKWVKKNSKVNKMGTVELQNFVIRLEKIAKAAAPYLDKLGKALLLIGSTLAIAKWSKPLWIKPPAQNSINLPIVHVLYTQQSPLDPNKVLIVCGSPPSG